MRTNISTTRGNTIFRALLVLVSVFVAQMVSAQSYDNGILKYYIAPNGEAAVAGLSSSNLNATSIAIPATITYNGITYPVTEIRPNAFENQTKLTKVTYRITNLKEIAWGAFDGCTNLSMFASGDRSENENRIYLADGITSVGAYAFSNCPKLTEFYILNGRNNKVIDKFWFGTTRYITSAIIQGTVPDSVLYSMSSLQSVSIQDPSYTTDVQSFEVGKGAFDGCTNLKSMTIGSKFTKIGDKAFSNTALTSVTIPSNVTSVGNEAFYYCRSLTTATVNSTTIGDRAFYLCTSLKNLTLNNTKKIGKEAFRAAPLSKIELPEGLTDIGDNAFYDDLNEYSLVVLPKTLTFNAGQPHWLASNAIINSLVVKPARCSEISDFLSRVLGTNHIERLEIAGTKVGKKWCRDATELKEVIFDNANVAIGDDAFSGCTGLASLNITASSIGKNAFFGCTGIKNANIVSPTVESFAFAGCTSMQTLTVNASTKLGFGAFSGCSALTSTRITSLPKLTAPCFQGCGGQVIVETTTPGLSTYSNVTSPFYGSNFTMATTLCHAKSLFTGCTKLESLYLYNPKSSWVGNIMSDCPNVKTVGVVGTSNDAFRIDESDCLCYISSTKYLLVIPPAKKSIVLKEDGLRYTFPTGGLSQYHGIIDATKLTQVPFFQDSHYDATVLCTPSMEAEFKKYFDADKVIVKGDGGLKGDMNGDGKVTISDVNILVDELLK